jgi:DNA-binding GntR family transcriptional regulator
MIEIFDLREILECAAVKFFIERKTEDSISALRKAYYEQLEVYKQKDPYVFMEKDRQFHLEIIKGAKHKRMEEIMGILNNQIKMLAIRIRNDNYVLDFSIIDHQRILEAIEKNDVETATESLRQHIRKVKNYNESKYFLLKKP